MSEHPLSPESRRETAILGLWVFLGSECLFFGALILSLAVYRFLYPAELAEGTRRLSFTLGTLNTAVLLTSSFTMAWAVSVAEEGKSAKIWLHATALFGLAFLAIKFVEYREHWQEGMVPGLHLKAGLPSGLTLFFCLYFILTGLHALHLSIGIGITEWLALSESREKETRYRRCEVVGLYWHFVDLVWVFLYPALYLWGRSG